MIKKIILVVVMVAAIVGLTYVVRPAQTDIPERAVIKFNNPKIKDKEVVLSDYVRYPGKDGESVFDLLLDLKNVKAPPVFKRYDFGVFVESINGVKPGESQFWKLYVNGEEAQVGADQIQTKKGDIVEWILEDINSNGETATSTSE